MTAAAFIKLVVDNIDHDDIPDLSASQFTHADYRRTRTQVRQLMASLDIVIKRMTGEFEGVFGSDA